MNYQMTELVFILDRSGSMGGLESDTIGGFNSLLAEQQAKPGQCRLTTVLFDDRYEMLHDRIDIGAVKPMCDRQYFVRGSTALLDAVGKTIRKLVDVQRSTAEEYRAGKVLFVITTDGMENASRKHTHADIKRMIEHQKTKYDWEFIFMGANIDAVEVAESIGIKKNRAQNFHSDHLGVPVCYGAVSNAIGGFRDAARGVSIGDDWSVEIQKDFESRKK